MVLQNMHLKGQLNDLCASLLLVICSRVFLVIIYSCLLAGGVVYFPFTNYSMCPSLESGSRHTVRWVPAGEWVGQCDIMLRSSSGCSIASHPGGVAIHPGAS